jgi:hypothetical protein
MRPIPINNETIPTTIPTITESISINQFQINTHSQHTTIINTNLIQSQQTTTQINNNNNNNNNDEERDVSLFCIL